MKKHQELLLIIGHALIFVYLFYKQYLGLNLFVFELLAIGSILFILKIKTTGVISKIVLIGTLLSGIAVVINFSVIAIFLNICSFYLFTGTMVYPKVRSILTAAALSVTNFFQSFLLFFQLLSNLKSKTRGIKWLFNFIRIGLLPVLVIIVFIIIYDASNPIFSKGLTKIGDFFDPLINDFFKDLNFELIPIFILGLLLSIFTFLKVKNNLIINEDAIGNDEMIRSHRKVVYSTFKFTGLKNELKSALFLLVALNILLLIVNTIDIYWVWFNFEWQGEYLKQFVHEGTHLLILSILISMAIVLYFFRSNLNFYSKNKSLKMLAYIWLAQNAVLAISVAIRNFWYIKYFALAYKRIGVLFFLLVTLYGIYTVYIKVRDTKTLFYLLRTNNLAIYCVLIVMTFFNWDVIIARYNFKHYEKSFVHFNFLSSLSYKALPYLDKDIKELAKINEIQKKLFPFEEQYMGPEEYYKCINLKKTEFIAQWEEKNLKSWNFAEYNAYIKLKQ